MKVVTTLCYIVKDQQVLLAMKKRGLGEGMWNGPGGKVQSPESVEAACRREVLEETGLQVGPLEHRGIVRFFDCGMDGVNECHVYVATEAFGEPIETEEMRPQWFSRDAIPYHDMWESDPRWLPRVLAGGRVDATFWFDENNTLTRWELR